MQYTLRSEQKAKVQDSAATSACTAALAHLQARIPWEGFESWFSSSKPVSLENGTLTLAVHSQGAVDWIHSEYKDLLLAAAKAARVSQIDFIVDTHAVSENRASEPAGAETGPSLTTSTRRIAKTITGPAPSGIEARWQAMLNTPASAYLKTLENRQGKKTSPIVAWNGAERVLVDTILANIQNHGHEVGWLGKPKPEDSRGNRRA